MWPLISCDDCTTYLCDYTSKHVIADTHSHIWLQIHTCDFLFTKKIPFINYPISHSLSSLCIELRVYAFYLHFSWSYLFDKNQTKYPRLGLCACKKDTLRRNKYFPDKYFSRQHWICIWIIKIVKRLTIKIIEKLLNSKAFM